jgi:hypothetical protein
MLYVPGRVADAGTPAADADSAAVRFQEKWRHALTLVQQVRAAGFQLTAVIGDAECGDVTVAGGAKFAALRTGETQASTADLTKST